MVNVGKYTVNVGAYSTVDGSEIRRENHLRLVVDLPLFTTDSFAFQVVGLGIYEPSTVGSMEQKRYIYRSMKRWFLWDFHVGKYTTDPMGGKDSKGIKFQVRKKGLLFW